MKVYLAGPIQSCSDDEVRLWRAIATAHLGPENVYDPMSRDLRGREDTEWQRIVSEDKSHLRRADAILAYVWKPSVGTAMEIMYASELGRLVIVVVPPPWMISPWLRYHADEVFRTLDAALRRLRFRPAPAKVTFSGWEPSS